MGRPKTKKAKLAQLKQSDMLLMLWGTDYMPLIHAMLQRDETLTSLVVNYLHSNKSRYAPLGDVETLGDYFLRKQMSVANVVQVMLSCGHQQSGIDALKLVKSFSALRQNMPRRQWQAEVKHGTLINITDCKKKLKQMKALKPPSTTPKSPYLARQVSDQLLLYRGCKKKKVHRSVESTGEDDKKVNVQSKVILNMIDYPVDATQNPITEEEAEQIREGGIWTEPAFDTIREHLDWETAQETLHTIMDEHSDIMDEHCGNGECPSRADMLYLLQRPDYLPMHATEREVLQPIPDCDTNNYNGMQKYGNQLLELYPDAIFILCHMDGQGLYSMFTACNMKHATCS